MPRDLAALSERMTTFVANSRGLNLHAQAHARGILRQLETPPSGWPAFNADLDERLSYSADLMITHGLDLLADSHYADLATELLRRGAEALEYLCQVGLVRGLIGDELLKAAVAYHISGFHARSYVLIQRLRPHEAALGRWATVVVSLLNGDLRTAQEQTIETFEVPEFRDSVIAEALGAGELPEDDAIAQLGRHSLARAVLLYLEYLKSGASSLLENAITTCRDVASLGREGRHVDLWWWGRALEYLFRRMGDAGIWTHLHDIGPTAPWGPLARPYIESHITRTPAVMCLWPSQLRALDLIKDGRQPSFCVRMPTSAGKTKIAELAIVHTLLQDPMNVPKCVYVAPFRSLAIEVERTLTRALRPLGVRVSELYGGFELSSVDEDLIRETQVLIATPEKLDAVVRLAPDLVEDVRLVIIDEGQIVGDNSERGLRAEFLISRLLRRLGREQCRFVFISAVLPNLEEFAQWIGGDPELKVETDWRPTRLLLGECQWNGSRVRLEYTHEAQSRLEQRVFVPRFLVPQDVQGLEGMGRRRRPFPADANEAFAGSAVRLTRDAATLVFVPQARQVVPTARRIADARAVLNAIAATAGETGEFPNPDLSTDLMEACLAAIGDELGDGAEIAGLVQAGIAVHHGDLPGRVRLAMEQLIRAGELRIIVATTTLGQGVNLPIRTVLVRGVQQGYGVSVDAHTFWNIAGRAGRAMHENEGHVLFFIDETASNVGRMRRTAQRLIAESDVPAVVGSLHRALRFLRRLWQRHAANIDFDALCVRLAEDDFSWAAGDSGNLERVFRLIDQHLLAVVQEESIGPDDADALQEILRESLLCAQLEARPIPNIDLASATAVLCARVASVFRRVPNPQRRAQFYQMGLSLADCAKVEAASDSIVGLIGRMAEWEGMDSDEQMEMLLNIADIALELDAVEAPEDAPLAVLRALIEAWLLGRSCVQMIADGLAEGVATDAGKLSRILERMCVYGMSWVVTGLVSFAKHKMEAESSVVPNEALLLPGMFKYGLRTPAAAVLAPYVQRDRRLAEELASVCPHEVTHVDRIIAWFHNVRSSELESAGLDRGDVDRIAQCQRPIDEILFAEPTETTNGRRIVVRSQRAAGLAEGDTVVFRRRPDRGPTTYDIRTTDGLLVGSFTSKTAIPEWLNDVSNTQTVIRSVDVAAEDDRVRMELVIRRLSG